MNSDFPRIISLLRKEKGISQKYASQQLGVSQSLLSHYEKGIRECGLSFVVKVADFYGVSCDYLLGRSPERNGATIEVNNIKDPSTQKEILNPQTLKIIYKKKILFCSLNILFDILSKAGSSRLINEVSSFLYLAVYRMFRVIFRINKKNKNEMFVVEDAIANQSAQSEMIKFESTSNIISSGVLPKKYNEPIDSSKVQINNEILEQNYPEDHSALLNLVKCCETILKESE